MAILNIIAIVYLAIGVIYGTYVLISGFDPWYLFPINALLWPLGFIINSYLIITGKFKSNPDNV